MRRARAAVADLPGVLEIQTYGDLLHIFVDDAAQRLPQVEQALADHAIQAEGLRQTHARMEEAFVSLIRRQEHAGERINSLLAKT
jgi:hypothetical protein